MTKKFCKEWGLVESDELLCEMVQRELNGGANIVRTGRTVSVSGFVFPVRDTPVEAVKFAAALNKLRRPLRLIKQDLDADWAARVKERDGQTCAICGVQGDKQNASKKGRDVLTAHHWLKTKARAGMARWARPCGVTVHFAEHIHLLHENPCWMDLKPIHDKVAATEEPEQLLAAISLTRVEPTEALVRALWLERCGKMEGRE